MKLEITSINISNDYPKFTDANSGVNFSNGNGVNLNFGDTNRLSNLYGNNQFNQTNTPVKPEQNTNSPMMNFVKTLVGGIAQMLGIDPQKFLQFLGLDTPQNNQQNFQTGAGAINNVGGKAANMANDPMIRQAMEQMQAEQAANPGKAVKKTVKGSDGKKYKLSLDENGQMEIKKKKKGFFGKLFDGIGKVFKTGLGLLANFGSFIPGWGTIASVGANLLLGVMNKKQ